MNIGIVCYPTFGGSGVLATELGKALANRGHEVHFIAYQQPVRLDSFHPNIMYHEVSVPKYPLFDYHPFETALSSTIVNESLSRKLDILHVHYAIPHASAAFFAQQILKTKNIELPFITTLHGTDITLVGKDKSFEPVVSFSINSSDGVTSVSDSLKQETISHFNIDKEVRVIYNFVDTQRFKKKPLDHYKKMIAPQDEFIISHASNFRKVKRTEDIIRIFAEVIKSIPAKLLMVGDGPERQSNEMLCRELNLCNNVKFLGKQDVIEDIYSISDVFLLPSETESFGLSALEAMACEVPVVSSNTGGIPEVNVHGKTGFLFDVGDIQGMANGIVKMYNNKELHREMQVNALVQAQAFDIQKIVPQYENLYLEVIENKKRGEN